MAFQSRHLLNRDFSFMIAMTSLCSERVACDDNDFSSFLKPCKLDGAKTVTFKY